MRLEDDFKEITEWNGKKLYFGFVVVSKTKMDRILANEPKFIENLPRVNLETGVIKDQDGKNESHIETTFHFI